MAKLTDIAWAYKLNEASGNALDASGVAPNLNQVNSPSATTGKLGGARGLAAASSQWFYHDGHNNFNLPGTVNWYICGWFKISTKTNYRVIIRHGSQYSLYYNQGNDRMTCECQNASNTSHSVSTTNAGSVSINTWHLLEAWYVWGGTNGSLNISMNGSVETPTTVSGGIKTLANTTFQFGYPGFGGQYWDGELDQWVGRKGSIMDATDRTQIRNSGNGLAFELWGVNLPAIAHYYRRMRG